MKRTKKRRRLATAAAAALLIGLSAQSAAAQGPYDPLGLRFGGFDVRPSVDIGVESTDNVFATETGEQDDVVYVVRPDVVVESHWSRHQLRAEIGGQHTSYQDFSSNDSTTGFADANVRLDVLSSTQLELGGRTAKIAESRSDPDSPAGAAEPVEYTQQTVRADLRHTFNRVRVSVGGTQNEYDFEDSVDAFGAAIDEDGRDRSETAGYVRGEYAVSPALALVAQASANTREYDVVDPLVNRDSDGKSYLVGASFDVTNLIRGEVTVGYFEQNYDDPDVGTVDGVAVAANAEWRPTQLTTVHVAASRSPEETGVGGAVSNLQTVGSVRVDHELRRNIVLTAGVDGGNREYRGVDREDSVLNGDVGVRYLVNRNVAVSGGYRFESQDSDVLGEDFEVNRLFLTLSLRV